MGKLILNIGKRTGWAVFHHDKTKKITSGTHHYRTFKGFCDFFNSALYNHDPIDYIYCQTTSWKDNYYFFKARGYIRMHTNYSWINAKDSCEELLGCDLKNHQKIIDYIKTLGYLPDNIEEACAIVTAHIFYQHDKYVQDVLCK
jgi:hypothetical protein